MNILITGGTGFVANVLIKKLKTKILNPRIYATYRRSHSFLYKDVNYIKIDLNNYQKIISIINDSRPDFIINLAAQSSVQQSWEKPVDSYINNLNIYLNVLEAVRMSNYNPLILSIGSSEVYGIVDKNKLPIKENYQTIPINPYAVSRLSQENLSKIYIDGYGLKIIMTRSFNHCGLNQDRRFFIPNVISQIFDKKSKSISLGNLDIIRDYINVEDVSEAYIKLLFNGKVGEIYNICSGIGYSLREIVNKIFVISDLKKPIKKNKIFERPNDNPVIVGDYSKINMETKWHPKFKLEDSLNMIILNEKKKNSI